MTTHVMTTTPLSTTGQRGREASSEASWLRTKIAKLEAWWSWNRSYRQTVRELSELSTNELDDIGVARCDIPVIAMQSANKTYAVR